MCVASYPQSKFAGLLHYKSHLNTTGLESSSQLSTANASHCPLKHNGTRVRLFDSKTSRPLISAIQLEDSLQYAGLLSSVCDVMSPRCNFDVLYSFPQQDSCDRKFIQQIWPSRDEKSNTRVWSSILGGR